MLGGMFSGISVPSVSDEDFAALELSGITVRGSNLKKHGKARRSKISAGSVPLVVRGVPKVVEYVTENEQKIKQVFGLRQE